ncbi:MAG: helix-turn-helix domain-containing protein [Sporolactobacillus sp.]
MALEKEKFKVSDPDYQILASHFNRNRPYSQEEIEEIAELKSAGFTINQIAKQLGRTY